jgi:hypothetical protein
VEVYVGTSGWTYGWTYGWNEGGNLDWFVGNAGLNAVELKCQFLPLPLPEPDPRLVAKGKGTPLGGEGSQGSHSSPPVQ